MTLTFTSLYPLTAVEAPLDLAITRTALHQKSLTPISYYLTSIPYASSNPLPSSFALTIHTLDLTVTCSFFFPVLVEGLCSPFDAVKHPWTNFSGCFSVSFGPHLSSHVGTTTCLCGYFMCEGYINIIPLDHSYHILKN